VRKLVVALVVVALFGCTEQQLARNWGGTDHVELPAGQKLVTLTWHDDDLWYLTRPMRADEEPETYTLSESASWGIVQGEVVFVERR